MQPTNKSPQWHPTVNREHLSPLSVDAGRRLTSPDSHGHSTPSPVRISSPPIHVHRPHIMKSTQLMYVWLLSRESHHHCTTQSPAVPQSLATSGMVMLNCV